MYRAAARNLPPYLFGRINTLLYNKRRAGAKQAELEKFRLDVADDLSVESVRIRPGNVLVAVRNPNSLQHLQRTLEKTDTRKIDIAVLAVRNVTQAGSGEHPLDADQLLVSSALGKSSPPWKLTMTMSCVSRAFFTNARAAARSVVSLVELDA